MILSSLKTNNNEIEEDEFSIKNKFEFHTFSEPADKLPVYVLKNHYHMSCTDMLNRLTSCEVPASKVTFLNDNEANPSYIVHFNKKEIDLSYLLTHHKVIDCLVVKWQKFNKNKKKYTECFNCQQFGHTSRNCGKSYKCVKCVESHEPGKCSRITKEGNPTCSNCKGSHAANSKNCEVFINYKKKIDSFKAKKNPYDSPKVFHSTPAPWSRENYNVHFPPPPSPKVRIDPRDRAGVSQENDHYNNFLELKEEFNSIPEIQKTLTLFKELIVQLKSTEDHNTRINILLKYQFP